MPDDSDLFGEDQESVDEFDRLTHALSQHILEFAEDEDIDDEMLWPLLLRVMITTHMASYVATTAKPSAGGLKLDLDRLRRDIEDAIRETKKDAEAFVAHAKASIAAAELDEEED